LRWLAGALRRAPRRLSGVAILTLRAAPGYARALPAGRPWFVLRARLLPMDIRDRLARRTLAQRIMDHQSPHSASAIAGADTPHSTHADAPDVTVQAATTPPDAPQKPHHRTRYVLVVRHGQTHFNVEGRLPGQIPGVGLTDEGRRQAHQAAVALSALPLSAIIASPLERARDTAAIIARGWALPIRLDPRLMDTDVGAWSGQTIADVAKNDPAWKAFIEHPDDPPPGVESLSTVQARAVAAVEAALDDPTTGDYLVVVAHADVVKLIIAHYSHVEIDGIRFMSIANASISALAFPEVIPAPTDATPAPDAVQAAHPASTPPVAPAAPENAPTLTAPQTATLSSSATPAPNDPAREIGVNGASTQTTAEQSPARPQRLTPTLLAVNWTQTPHWLVGSTSAARVSVAGVPAPTASPSDAGNPSGDTEGYMATHDAPTANGEGAPIQAMSASDQAPAPTTADA